MKSNSLNSSKILVSLYMLHIYCLHLLNVDVCLLTSGDTVELQAKYHIQKHRESLLIFNENVDHPTAHTAVSSTISGPTHIAVLVTNVLISDIMC